MISLADELEQQVREWRARYFNLSHEFGEIINQQQDKIISLQQENKRLKREIWNLKKTTMKNQNKDKMFLRFESSAKQKEHLELLAKIRGISRQELLTQVVEHFIDNNLQLIQNYKNEFEELNNRTSKKIKMQGE